MSLSVCIRSNNSHLITNTGFPFSCQVLVLTLSVLKLEYSEITMSFDYHDCCITVLRYHEDIIRWKHFPCYWPFVRGIHWSLVDSTYKGQGGGAWMFSARELRVEQTIRELLIWGAITLIITLLWQEMQIDGILPKGPYPPCLRMADGALLAGYPRNICGYSFIQNVSIVNWL